jgi:VTC domain
MMLQAEPFYETRHGARELKFLVSPGVASGIHSWARRRLAPDAHAGGATGDEYHITSLYLDTPQLDVYHRRGSFKRSKFRVRRYGDSETVFLERKLRTSTLLVKRRTEVTHDALARLTATGGEAHWPGAWFERRIAARGLQATCQVSYWRTARVGAAESGPVRLTIDRLIRARPVHALRLEPADGLLLLPVHLVVELKFRGAVPVIFRELGAEFALEPLAVSKYRVALEALHPSGGVGRPVAVGAALREVGSAHA